MTSRSSDVGAPNGGREADTESSPKEMEAPNNNGMAPTAAPTSAANKAVDNVLYSDIGITVLLSRLKQSVASARDFAGFLKKRSSLEEDHAQGLKKITRATHEATTRSEGRQGSFALQLADVTRVHERMADNGIQFALSLQQMHDELTEMSTTMERGRKHWKGEGLSNEKRVKDAEQALEKAKGRYDSSAESYDKVKTGDSSGRTFGIKGPKSAEQREEDLHRKMQTADSDYQSKVQAAQSTRQENLNMHRPQAVKALQDLIQECDNALTLQMQRFAALNEKLLVSNGMIVSPLRDPEDSALGAPSMREMVQRIDNQNDLHTFVISHSGSVPPRPAEIKYEKHPTQTQPAFTAPPQQQQRQVSQPQPQPAPMAPIQQAQPVSQPASTMTTPQASLNTRQGPPTSSHSAQAPSPTSYQPGYQSSGPQPSGPQSAGPQGQSFRGPPSAGGFPGPGQGPGQPAQTPKGPMGPQSQGQPGPQYQPYNRPPNAGPGGYPPPGPQQGGFQRGPNSPNGPPTNGALSPQGPPAGGPANKLPPYNRVFGMKLDQLFQRDDSAVPMVVYQCIQAVELFGLEVEGIYRLSGNANHVQQLRAQFDHDSSRVDFRNPENFFHDVNSVAGLLKVFFRELPDPLFTKEHYQGFIEAAKIEDDIQRRDSLHAIINALPDPNYATMRALILHLYRVQESSGVNKMTTQNLAICFAPTMMGAHTMGAAVADSALQARAVATILQNTYQIFDED